MRVLADTNIFIKFCRRLPLPGIIEKTLDDVQTRHTDTRLKRMKGFPQRYFVNVAAQAGR